MAGHTENISRSELWGGNGSPFEFHMGNNGCGCFSLRCFNIWGLLTAYGFARHQAYLGLLRGNFNAMPF